MGRRKQPIKGTRTRAKQPRKLKGTIKTDSKPRIFHRGPGGRFVSKAIAEEIGATRERYQMQIDSGTGRIVRGIVAHTRTATTKVILPETVERGDQEQGLLTRALSKSSVFKSIQSGLRAVVIVEGTDSKTGRRVKIAMRDLDLRSIAEGVSAKKKSAVLNKVVVGHIVNELRNHGYRTRYPIKTVQAKLAARGKPLVDVPKQGPNKERINVNKWSLIKSRTELRDLTVTVRVFKK